MSPEEKEARIKLWTGHGHNISMLYGDDGEMQCSLCFMLRRHWDYRRTPIEKLEKQGKVEA